MRPALELLLRLLDADEPAYLSREDLTGPLADGLRRLQEAGFIDRHPCMNPAPACPYCLTGTPYRVDTIYLCPLCRSCVAEEDLSLWYIDRETLLSWVSSALGIEGHVELIDDSLWRLGRLSDGPLVTECFYGRGAALTQRAARKLSAFRSVLLLHGRTEAPSAPGAAPRTLGLLELIDTHGGVPRCFPLSSLLRRGGTVRFHEESGELLAGDLSLGRIAPGTREYHLVRRLAATPGSLVPYPDLKRAVCDASGSRDGTEEATFCQKLKSRIKGRYRVSCADRLIETDPKGGGYRLTREIWPGVPWERGASEVAAWEGRGTRDGIDCSRPFPPTP